MKTLKRLNAKWRLLLFFFGTAISVNAQVVVVNQGFENTCSNAANAFYTGCIPSWTSASGTPDVLSNFPGVAAYQGSKYAHMYAKYDYNCYPTMSRSESIILNYNFQAGTTYRITYAARGNNTSFIPYTVTSNWILTNGLTNKTGSACAIGEECQAIPSGSQSLPAINCNINSWTVNQHVFTPTANFSQLWFYLNVSSTTINSQHTIMMYLDDVKIEEICTPTPTITGPSAFCEGSPISLTGTSNCTITNNVWTVVESDQFGTPVVGATEWWSPWAVGTPGVLNIPTVANGGPTMQCGKYYKVKLAVQTSFYPWVETSKVIFIKCPPSIKLKGSTSSICSGNSANLNASLVLGGNIANYTLTWTQTNPVGPVVYSGPMASIIVNPTVTTTYTATVTDNITGCSINVPWTVNVTNNDPSFNLSVNTSNNSYFTLSALANNQSASSIPGFGFAWFVEELDASNNAIFTFTNPSCWWQALNTPTVFNGINCVANTYSGASTIANCAIPSVGQFLYGHKYRITRGVWNDLCPWSQTSITVTPVKTQNGIELVEDHSAPDFSGALSIGNNNFENTVSIYPNPTDGLFTIDLQNIENAQIEIYTVFGQKVKSLSQIEAKTTIDMTGFTKGIYFVKIKSNGKEEISKIILE